MKLEELSQEQHIKILENSRQDEVKKLVWGLLSQETLGYLAGWGKTDKIADKAFEMLNNPSQETLKYLAERGKTDKIADKAFEMLDNPSENTLKYLAKWGKTDKIRNKCTSPSGDLSEFM